MRIDDVAGNSSHETANSVHLLNRRNLLLATTAVAAAAPFGVIPTSAQQSSAQAAPSTPNPPSFSSEELTRRTMERRAVDAAIWGMPIVSVDAMREAFFRDAKANYNDIVFWSKIPDWKFQTTTMNTSVLYVYFNINTKEGPVVLEVPATVGAGLFGTLVDAWQAPLVDVGAQGEDQGKGGKYLLLPPDYTGETPAGYIVVRSPTYNGLWLIRSIPKTFSEADMNAAVALIKKLRSYPLAKAGSPPEQRFVDMSGKLFDGIAHMDESFYSRLAKMVNEEPVQSRDLAMMGLLLPLGIEKGKDFKPDTATRSALQQGIREAHAWLMDRLSTYYGERYWSDAKWEIPAPPVSHETAFTYQRAHYLDVDARAAGYFSFYVPPKKLGGATYYLAAFFDGNNQPLSGENTYRLHVPANVPARQFWAVTVYDLETSSFMRDTPNQGTDSYRDLKKNADGSVDLYFGPKAPAGQESNWVATAPGKKWFPYFRFYEPEQPLFEKTWKLPDFEQMK